jgi:hypothetical protein
MPDPDLKELRRLAEGATPGPWILSEASRWIMEASERRQGICDYDDDPKARANAAYIAAANPSTILSLLDRLEATETSGYKRGIEDAAEESKRHAETVKFDKETVRGNAYGQGYVEAARRIAVSILKLEPK